jgi:hypothetical protein
MSEPLPTSSQSTAGPAAGQLVDRICGRFQEALQAGKRPRIEQLLRVAPEEARRHLFQRLLAIELTHRFRAGEAPARQEYAGRFADHAETVKCLFAELAGRAHADYLVRTMPYKAPAETGVDSNATRSESPAAPAPAAQPSPNPPQALPAIPGYDILGVLGRGGMGVVYKARQTGFNRLVALKMILAAGGAGQDELSRFRTEAEAVARLRHPNIVQVHEFGEFEGKPFFSLEFCGGGTLKQHLDGTPLPARHAAGLAEILARATHAAHGQQIVHRDLKPANVLLQAAAADLPDEQPGPAARQIQPALLKISDFGLAKKLDLDDDQTRTGAVMGTPSYMAPEQASGLSKAVGPAADIYALGVILYEMLTGRPPFKGATIMETLDLVRTREPVPPTQQQASTPRDLETICLKCLQKEPSHRYATAYDLAEDLRRFLAGEPIVARPVGRTERLVKWAKRRPGVAALAAAVLVTLLLGTTISTGLAIVADRNASLAEKRADALQKETARANELTGIANRKTNEALLREKEAKDEARKKALQAYDATMLLAQNTWESNQVLLLRELLESQREPVNGEDLRGFEWHYWCKQMHHGHATLAGHAKRVRSVAFSRDGKRLASADQDGTVLLWDAMTNRLIRPISTSRRPDHLAFSPDGEHLAVTDQVKGVVLLDTRTFEPSSTFGGPSDRIMCVAFSPDGTRIATGGLTVKVWDRRSGTAAALVGHTSDVMSVAFSPDGRFLATGGFSDAVKVWDLTRRQAVTNLPGSLSYSLAFSPGGRYLACSGDSRGIRVWDKAAGKHVAFLEGHKGIVHGVAFADDVTLASCSSDGTVRIWSMPAGKERLVLRGHNGRVSCVAPGGWGEKLASGGDDQTVRLWDVVRGAGPLTRLAENTRESESAYEGVAFSPDSKHVALGMTWK